MPETGREAGGGDAGASRGDAGSPEPLRAPCGTPHVPFARRLRPAVAGGGFALEGWWVWCGSAVRGEDGRHHLFAARWPGRLKFLPAYQSYSEVVRASADRPEGPYRLEEVVLGDRGPEHWDGRMTHNPTVVRWQGRYVLFYIGTTFDGPKPSAEELAEGPAFWPWYRRIRIGFAESESVCGPWRRRDQPLLVARPGMWDEHVVTNPSPCVASDGRLLLYYRSFIRGRGCRLGLAIYEDLDAGPVWRSDEPLVDARGVSLEDPFVFETGGPAGSGEAGPAGQGHFEMLAKDLNGAATGELHACAHLLSPDGLRWHLAPEPKAYGLLLPFDDGITRRLSHVERPFLLVEGGEPTHLFAAMAEGGQESAGAFEGVTRTWNGVVPLGTGLR